MSDKAEDVHSELLMLYTNSINEINNFKQQQWHVTNYAMLVYAGLFSLSRVVATHPSTKLVLVGLILVTCFMACQWIYSLDTSIHARRARLDHIRIRHFTQAFRNARDAGPSVKLEQCWFFILTLALGAGVAALFLFLPPQN